MKKVISCLNCGDLKRLNHTYQAEAMIITVSTLTGDRKKQPVIGRLCAKCAKDAGYKVRQELLDN